MSDCAEILCIGTEILLGNIVNSNSATLSRSLAELGINVYRHTAVGDNPDRLREALEAAFERSNIVVTTGGLGPTYDDLTKETIAAFFGKKLVRNEAYEKQLCCFFERLGRPMTENNLKQAMMPEGCIILKNPNGTAPGAIIEGENGRIAIMLPGPPREVAPMLRDEVMPYLARRSSHVLRSHCVYFFGIGESALEHELHGMMPEMSNPTVAPYAKDGEVMLRVTAAADTDEQAEQLMQPVLAMLREKFGELIYGVDVGDLQTAAVRALHARGLTAATAESCTGGYLAKRLTDVPGSSEVFECGLVTYSNEIKEKLLGVKPETLEQFGAVSEETAHEMADAARRVSGADIGIGITGIAGPDGGSEDKPVGLVYIALSSIHGQQVGRLTLARRYEGERELIRYLSSSHALSMLMQAADKFPVKD